MEEATVKKLPAWRYEQAEKWEQVCNELYSAKSALNSSSFGYAGAVDGIDIEKAFHYAERYSEMEQEYREGSERLTKALADYKEAIGSGCVKSAELVFLEYWDESRAEERKTQNV